MFKGMPLLNSARNQLSTRTRPTFLIRAFFKEFVSEALVPIVTPLSASTRSGLAVKALNGGEELSNASCFFVTSMGHL